MGSKLRRWPVAPQPLQEFLQYSATERSAQTPSPPETPTYTSLLRKCGQLKALCQGRRVHILMLKSGQTEQVFLYNLLVEMYGLCAAMDDAVSVFNRMAKRNVFTWNLLIGAYVMNGLPLHALPLYHQMQYEGFLPDEVTFVSMLSALGSNPPAPTALPGGRSVHVSALHQGLDADVIVGTALLNFYGKLGSLHDAEQVFACLPVKNAVSWNVMLTVYLNLAQEEKAFRLFHGMEEEGMVPTEVTFNILLPCCIRQANLTEGKKIHVRILYNVLQLDVMLGNSLINMYGKCGALDSACSVFLAMPERDVVTWNTIIEFFVQHEWNDKALQLFYQMKLECIMPDGISYVSMLSSCVSRGSLNEGKRLHSLVLSCPACSNVVTSTAVINMYAKCGSLENAHQAFNEMPKRNLVTWNTMIAAYAQHGQSDVALELVQYMLADRIVPNDSTFHSIFSACSHSGFVEEGLQWFHFMTNGCKTTPTVQHLNCILDLLGRSGQLDEAEALIHSVHRPSLSSWSSLLSACRLHADIDWACQIAECSSKLNPENPAPFLCLLNVYTAAGKWDNARRVRKKLKDLNLSEDSLTEDEVLVSSSSQSGIRKIDEGKEFHGP